MCSIPRMCSKLAEIPWLSSPDHGFYEVAGNWFPDFASNVVCVACVCVVRVCAVRVENSTVNNDLHEVARKWFPDYASDDVLYWEMVGVTHTQQTHTQHTQHQKQNPGTIFGPPREIHFLNRIWRRRC